MSDLQWCGRAVAEKTMAQFRQKGIVLSVAGDTARVRVRPAGGCPESHAGCPVRTLAESGDLAAEAANAIHAAPGDRVVVEMESPHYYKALFLVLVLPVVAMMGGYAVGAALGHVAGSVGEVPGVAGAALGLGASFLAMRLAGRDCEPRYTVIGQADHCAEENVGTWQG